MSISALMREVEILGNEAREAREREKRAQTALSQEMSRIARIHKFAQKLANMSGQKVTLGHAYSGEDFFEKYPENQDETL